MTLSISSSASEFFVTSVSGGPYCKDHFLSSCACGMAIICDSCGFGSNGYPHPKSCASNGFIIRERGAKP